MARVKSTKRGYTTKPGFKPVQEGSRRMNEVRGASFYASDSPGHGRYVVTLHERHTMSDEDDFTYFGSFDDLEEAKERAEEVLPYIGYDWSTPEGPRVNFYIEDSYAKLGAKDNMYFYIKHNVLLKHPIWESRQKTDNRELIEIPEDVQIPGTDVILEAGDTIRVFPTDIESRQEEK